MNPAPKRPPVKLAGSVRDRRHRGRLEVHELGSGGPPPFDRLRAMQAEPPGLVLSAYLAADTRRGEVRDRGWRLRFRALARAHLERLTDRDEANALVRLVSWIDRQLDVLATADVRRGVALFATEHPRRLELCTLPQPVEDRVTWDATADLAPLERLAADHPTAGIVVLDSRTARLITTSLGQPAAETVFRLDLDSADWRRMEGPAPGALRSSGTTQVDRYERRALETGARWLRGLAPLIGEVSRSAGWTRAVVVASPDLKLPIEDLGRWVGARVDLEVRRGWIDRPAAAIADDLIDEERT